MHCDLRTLCFFLIFLNFAFGQNQTPKPIKEKPLKQKDILMFYTKTSQKIDFIDEKIDDLEKKIPNGLIGDLDDIKNNVKDLKASTKDVTTLADENAKEIALLKQKDQKIDLSAIKSDIISELTSHFEKLFQTKMDKRMKEANDKFEKEIKKLDLVIEEFNKTIANNLINSGTNNGNRHANRLPVWMDPKYKIKTTNPCKPNPCLNGGSCVLESDGRDYQCELCPFPMGGKNCQDLVCEDTCFRLKDTVYFVYSDRSLSWDEANNKCTGKAMSLALIPDDVSRQFIRKELEIIYNNHPFTFWIGLERSSASDTWMWQDGTIFNSNFNSWFATSGSGNCVGIAKSNGAFNLNAEPCDGATDRKYYPLCQKKFPFLT